MPDDDKSNRWLGIPAPIWQIFVTALTGVIIAGMTQRNHNTVTTGFAETTKAAVEAKEAAVESKALAVENKVAVAKLPDVTVVKMAEAKEYGDVAKPAEEYNAKEYIPEPKKEP